MFFFTAMTTFACSVVSVNTLKCVSMNNQECKIKTKIIDIKKNGTLFYPYNIKINEGSESCNTITDPNAKFCVPYAVKKINIKVFNLMPRTNETSHIECDETC